MSTRPGVRVWWSGWALTLLLLVAALVIWGVDGFQPPTGTESLPGAGAFVLVVNYAVISATFAAIGALIIKRHVDNLTGWVCLAIGAMMAATLLTSVYAQSAVVSQEGPFPPGAAFVGWLSGLLIVWVVLLIPLVLLFPNGHLAGRHSAWILWIAAVGLLLQEVGIGLLPGPMPSSPALSNPFGLTGATDVLTVMIKIAQFTLAASALLATVALIVRMRRARGDELQQFKWIAYAGALWGISFVFAALAPAEWHGVAQFPYALILDGLLVALAVALLKYRLYDVDLVISRTLAYGALAALVTAVYVVVVVVFGELIGMRSLASSVDASSGTFVLSLLATGLVAVLFQPMRERVQRYANRLVYGERSSPYEVLAAFSRRMSGALSVEDTLPRMAEAAARGVGGQRGRVRVYVPGEADRAVAWPAEIDTDMFDRTIPVLHQGAPVGEISVAKPPGEHLTPGEEALLADLATQAGPALSSVRLTFELRARLAELSHQAEEVKASRERIVAAQDAERRRLVRDIHDGAQQHLVALIIQAGLARRALDADPEHAAPLLDEIRTQATETLTTLRDLARGVFPSLLADAGLVAALRAHFAKAEPFPRFSLDESIALARFEPRVEAAVYFCCLEALQNVAKHAPGAPCCVALREQAGSLEFAIADEGPGFDTLQPRSGTGLQGMADRLAAVNGVLRVVSVAGRGTVVSGQVPLVWASVTDRQLD